MGRDAKNLVKSLLAKDPTVRLKAEETTKHRWFRRTAKLRKKKTLPEENMVVTLRNLKNFTPQSTLQKAVLTYIASHLLGPKALQKTYEVFYMMDTDKNGELTRKELYEGFAKIYKNKSLARRDAEAVMKKADINRNGVIDYTGSVSDALFI